MSDTEIFDLNDIDWNDLLGDDTDEDISTDDEAVDESDETESADEVQVDETEDESEVDDEPVAESDDEVEDDDEVDEPQLYTIKVDGEERQVSLEDALKGYMRQADYTRKTQEIAAERDAAAKFKALEQAAQSNPEVALALFRQQLGLPEDTQALEDLDPIERELHELKASFTQMMRTQQEAAAQQAVTAELTAIQQTYGIPAEQWTEDAQDELLLYAVEHGTRELDVAYRAMNFAAFKAAEDATTKADAARQAKVAAKRKAPRVATGTKRSTNSQSKGASSDLSIEEALAETLRELNLTS
jgi:hypothetical protein